MNSTREYLEAMASCVREHEREIGAMAKATEGDRNRLESLRRLIGLLGGPAPMTLADALQAWNVYASPEWWETRGWRMINARKNG